MIPVGLVSDECSQDCEVFRFEKERSFGNGKKGGFPLLCCVLIEVDALTSWKE